ncbi:Peroxiredoxin [Chryseobacterium rhizoplanae]|uniref:Peroxiredoxin n=1 Tax=Chryseobacterium rhizoplanae TaxID=1609531 RepID=A0A521DPD8_9FLAO|nr:TlpA disulfide reductase family protein [Chryseobacterium rhizoplanae]SMO72790.1 Peroxiredoxin [Chryseobacterium rhizoplanae]
MYYKNKLILIIIFLSTTISISGQSVSMYFPHFAGKTYDFILFQGKDTKVQKGTIPADGRFTLEVPKELSPYTGMSRWLITGTQEGGGLDMIIPGHNFSVECTSAIPDNKNIIYKNNDENSFLNSRYSAQKSIVDRFVAMNMVIKAYPKDDKNYSLYQKELAIQKDRYTGFQKNLEKNKDYASGFLQTVNLTNGLGGALKENEEDNRKEILRTITENISWTSLYSSGHWDGVIAIFTDLEEKKDGGQIFTTDFKRIGDRISDNKLYTEFTDRITYYLTQSGNDNIIAKLSPIVLGSGKITSYNGILSVYQKATPGNKAPDLTISSFENGSNVAKKIDFTDAQYQKTLLVFYLSDCGHCETEMKMLAEKQGDLLKSKIRLIAISGDTDQKVFKDGVDKLQWKATLSCDLQGMKGDNFMNYGVHATPTLFVIDQRGNIVTRESTAESALKALADPSTELWRKIRKPPRPYVAPQQ